MVDERDEMSIGKDPQDVGRRVIVPVTFFDGPRYMHEKIGNRMAYVKYGMPS